MEQDGSQMRTLSGVLELSKGDVGVVGGVFLTGITSEQIEEFRGKEVEVMGKVETVPGQDLVADNGEISQGHKDSRTIMPVIESIKLA